MSKAVKEPRVQQAVNHHGYTREAWLAAVRERSERPPGRLAQDGHSPPLYTSPGLTDGF